MELSVRLTLDESEESELASILNCEKDNLPSVFAPYAEASVEELVTMFLGKKIFRRGSDILEYRLYLLIKHAFSSRIPDEQEDCRLFQTTASGSRSLMRAVMSKYQYLLKKVIEETLKDLLGKVDVEENEDYVTTPIHNQNFVDELNRMIGGIDSSLPPVQKKRASVSTYEIKPSSYKKMCSHFGIASKLKKQ